MASGYFFIGFILLLLLLPYQLWATTYYVSPNGSDSNNGLGPDASHASNKPWLTLGKLLGASGFASGDTAYVAPGVYRETITVNMTSATAETKVLGDPQNAQGFKDGSSNKLSGGEVRWTAYVTNDKTAPVTQRLIDLNARDFLTFQYLTFVGGTTSGVLSSAATSTDIKFTDCALLPGTGANNTLISFTVGAGVAANWTIDRCVFVGQLNPILTRNTGADYDANILVQNCLFMCPALNNITVTVTGANTFNGGGVDIYNCTFFGQRALNTATNVSTTIPCTIYNSYLFCPGGTALSSATSGQITEDYNLIFASTARSNVSTGTHSIADGSYSNLFYAGQELFEGFLPRPFGMPTSDSPLLGFGAQAGGPAVDLMNRARPSGGQSTSYALGAYEYHDSAAKETTVTDSGNGMKIIGGGDEELLIPVTASATNITVRVRYDTNHATTNKPQAKIVWGGEVGVADATATATVGVDTWETLRFSFTPTAAGFITLRLISRSAAGNGIAYFDSVSGGARGSSGLDYFRLNEPFPGAVFPGVLQ